MFYTLDVSLTILVWILVIFFAVVGYLLSMCLLELHKVLQNCTDISKVYKDEAKPLVDDLKITLNNVKKFTSGSNSNFNIVKSLLTGALGAGALMIGNLKSKKGGFLNGLISGFNMFRK